MREAAGGAGAPGRDPFGRRAGALLDGVRRFMVADSTVIMVVVLLLLGADVLGDGLTGIGR